MGQVARPQAWRAPVSVPRAHGAQETVLFRLAQAVHARAAAMLDEVLAERRTALESVGVYVERHVEWYLGEPDELPAYARDWNTLTGERLHCVLASRRHHEGRVRELIDAAKDDGDVDADLDTGYATRYILAAVNDIPVGA